MRRYLDFLVLGLLLLSVTGPVARAAEPATRPAAASDRKFTYVIVHGAWGGGWAFKEVDRLLTGDGHKVYRPTLTGQGEKVHLATPEVNLSTHIQDIVNVILYEDLHDIVLVGHSYGGMVVTGVADRVPDRIKHLVYLDAFVPEDGESVDAIRELAGKSGLKVTVKDGFVYLSSYNPNKPIPHDVPQPAKTFSEPISLEHQEAARKIPATYILTVDKGHEPKDDMFFPFYERAKARGWPTLIMEGDHNVQWSKPKELVELLEKAP
jgi:pimeloyl-ACP methyl ester carboxylesterase